MAFMSVPSPAAGTLKDPLAEVLIRGGASVLAFIIGVEGPSYRPIGAAMAIFEDASRAGTLSSGCIEADIGEHALETLKTGKPTTLRYGRGSPFFDITLPCGGGLDIILLPRPDVSALRQVAKARDSRVPCVLEINTTSGAMTVVEEGETGLSEDLFRVRHVPDIRFLVFGKGPEACTFSTLVQSAGYPNVLLSPDKETLEEAEGFGSATRGLVRKTIPSDVPVDPWTAITLFFHDHDWEPPLLKSALETPAFYIGAQGSQRARDQRMLELEEIGVDEKSRARLRGPIGLIPSARDARTLAVSVLAEILDEARHRSPS